MSKVSIECENLYSEWDLNIKAITKQALDIYNFLIAQKEISEKCFLKDYEYKEVSFGVLFYDGLKTHELNKEYRNKDYPADIITFAIFADSQAGERFVLDGKINLGEIIIALDKIEESADEKGVSKEAELAFFIAHGIMHLLGFDHQTEQEYNFVVKYQKEALESININYDKV